MANKLQTYQNNTLSFTITHTDGNGDAINITGATVEVKVYNCGTLVISKSITTHSNPTEGQTTCTFTNSETATFPVNLMMYEIQTTLASGSVYTMRDYLEVIQDL